MTFNSFNTQYHLEQLTVKTLKDICKQWKGVLYAGYSKYTKKADLIQFMLSEEANYYRNQKEVQPTEEANSSLENQCTNIDADVPTYVHDPLVLKFLNSKDYAGLLRVAYDLELENICFMTREELIEACALAMTGMFASKKLRNDIIMSKMANQLLSSPHNN